MGNVLAYAFSPPDPTLRYYVAIRAVDTGGLLSTYSNEVVTTPALKVTGLSANRTSPQPVGTSITFSATASGGTTPYQFKWWVSNGTTSTVGQNWSTSNAFFTTPTAPTANYMVTVWARNASSTVDAPDSAAAILSMTFVISSAATNLPPAVSLTAPAAGATFPAPATITVSANASDADGTVTNVGFYAGTTLIGSDTSAPYSVTWNAVAAGAYSLTARATDNMGATTTSAARAITVTAAGLPAGWTAADIGAPAVAGSTAYSGSGVFTLEAAGVDIWGESDEFHFAYRQMSGDVNVIARVASVENVNPWSKTGVMIRAALTGNAVNATMLATAASGLAYQRRTATGGSTVVTSTPGQAPVWLKLERRGSVVTAFWSSTGVTWTTVGTQTMTLPATIYVGLAATSHNTSTSNTSVFDTVTVTAVGANQAPTVTAGADQTITLPGIATLTGTVTDDGLPAPPGAVTRSWTRVSGPGTVIFSAPTAATTTATFSAAGTHVLRLTGSDSVLSRTDDVTVTVLPGSAPSPITLIQRAGKDVAWATSASLSFAAANTAGRWIGVAIRGGLMGQTFTVTDTRGNTYRKAVQLNETGDTTSVAIYYAENIAGSWNTVTVSQTPGNTLRFAIFEYAGIATSNSLDRALGAQGTSAFPNSWNITTTSSGDLVLGVLSTAGSRTVTAGSGYVLQALVPAAPNAKLYVEDRRQLTAGPVSADWLLNASDMWGVVVAAFRPAQAP